MMGILSLPFSSYGVYTSYLATSLSGESPLTPLQKGDFESSPPLLKGDLGGSSNLSQSVSD